MNMAQKAAMAVQKRIASKRAGIKFNSPASVVIQKNAGKAPKQPSAPSKMGNVKRNGEDHGKLSGIKPGTGQSGQPKVKSTHGNVKKNSSPSIVTLSKGFNKSR